MLPEGVVSTLSLSSDGGSDTASTASDDDVLDSAVAVRDDAPPPPSFGNISVANSSDIHFGNKTFYQGPVTIKQFLYANGKAIEQTVDSSLVVNNDNEVTPDNGLDNPSFVADFPESKATSAPKDSLEANASGFNKGWEWLQKFTQNHMVLLVSLLAILMVSLAILMVVLLMRHPILEDAAESSKFTGGDEDNRNTPIDSPIDPKANLTLPPKLKIIVRQEWLAQPPVNTTAPLKTPVPYVIIHHTATENCSSQAQCTFHVRFIQTFHIESRHWWDIGYNFLVGGDGYAYEGRGWTSEGAHTYGYNAKSIGIAFVGTFNSVRPPDRQIRACKLLIAKGLELGYISKDYKLLGMRQLQTSQSPGAVLYEEIKTWDHWAPAP